MSDALIRASFPIDNIERLAMLRTCKHKKDQMG